MFRLSRMRQVIKNQIDRLQFYHSVIRITKIGKAYAIRIYLYEPLKMIFKGERKATILAFSATKNNFEKRTNTNLNRFHYITQYKNLKEN